jgi:hypothetical protein
LGRAWKLLDPAKNTIADFDRSSWKTDIEGRLTIHTSIPESLLVLIILTNKLVHNLVKRSEQGGANVVPQS